MPPVPNVILAGPGRTQPWPMSDACWSPAMPAIGGAPGERGGLADGAGRVDDRRASRRAGCAARRGPRWSQPVAVAVEQSGDRGVGGVGDVERALGQVPDDPGVDRADAEVAVAVGVGVSSRWPTLVADWLGARRSALALQHEAVADGAQVLPAEARGRRARRWPGPTRSSRPAGWRCRRPSTGPASASTRRATSRAAAAMAVASNSTRPGAGRSRAAPRVGARRRRCASGRTTDGPDAADVPTSMTRMLMAVLLLGWSPPGPERHRDAGSPRGDDEGDGSQKVTDDRVGDRSSAPTRCTRAAAPRNVIAPAERSRASAPSGGGGRAAGEAGEDTAEQDHPEHDRGQPRVASGGLTDDRRRQGGEQAGHGTGDEDPAVDARSRGRSGSARASQGRRRGRGGRACPG